MILTHHSIERGQERAGLCPEAFHKLAGKAFHEGIRHKDTAGALHRYLTALYKAERKANNIRIYGEFVYLFCGEVLVTVLHLPNEFKKVVRKIKNGH